MTQTDLARPAARRASTPPIITRSVSVQHNGGPTVTVSLVVTTYQVGGRVKGVDQVHCSHVPLADWHHDPDACLTRALRLLTARFAPGW